MASLKQRIDGIGWDSVNKELLENGFAVIRPFLSAAECKELKALWSTDHLYRATIDMERYSFGKGRYRYFKYPLPEIIQALREGLYEKIAGTANSWSERLRLTIEYPKEFSTFAKQMREKGQTKPTPLILHYTKGGYNCLHQDINSDLVFPYQIVFGLTEKGKDYEGGQLILTQQRPRQQTVPHIITVPKGGAVLFTSNVHPQKGSRGFYQTRFKHGVGKIERGDRYTMGIVFHDFRR
ncbi:MAG: Prolyl 4-hydroxylase subunit alpha [Nitrospira sp.]|nr:MAG: Prolyl 4-hydroxylase subunit alpha [Nitrospira sp.]